MGKFQGSGALTATCGTWKPQRRPAVVPSAASSNAPVQHLPTLIERVAEGLTMMFPVWALLSGFTAYKQPALFNWVTGSQFEMGVGVLMLTMGLSLTKDDFKKVCPQYQ